MRGTVSFGTTNIGLFLLHHHYVHFHCLPYNHLSSRSCSQSVYVIAANVCPHCYIFAEACPVLLVVLWYRGQEHGNFRCRCVPCGKAHLHAWFGMSALSTFLSTIYYINIAGLHSLLGVHMDCGCVLVFWCINLCITIYGCCKHECVLSEGQFICVMVNAVLILRATVYH